MSRWLFAALVIFSSGSYVAAQTSEQEVMRAVQARVDAGRKGDSVAQARRISDDYTEVTVNGQLRDKKYAVSLAATPGMEIRDSTVQIFGDVGVVTGIQGETPNPQGSRFTHLWHKRNSLWVNAFVQNTSIKLNPPPTNPVAFSQITPTNWPRGKTQDERDVLEVQRGLNEAFAKKNSAAYAQLTADTFVRINADGNMISRGDFLKIVAGNADLQRVDKTLNSPPAGIRMTRVFVKQNGMWKQLVAQSTTVVQQ